MEDTTKLKDASPSKIVHEDALARDIDSTVRLAVEACDGHRLSDKDLDKLCDKILSDDMTASSPETRASGGSKPGKIRRRRTTSG